MGDGLYIKESHLLVSFFLMSGMGMSLYLYRMCGF